MLRAPDNEPRSLADALAVPGVVVLLARARWALRTLDAADIPRRNAKASGLTGCNSSARALARAARVVPWAANRVPWRADCLVQAIAAQDWLARRGVSSAIELGVDRLASSGIEPHAWLRSGDVVVTGGPVDRYTVLLPHPPEACIAAPRFPG